MNPILVANVVENNAHTERTRKQLRTDTSDVENYCNNVPARSFVDMLIT
ncbi:hypothetical protein T06_16216 [Trichinella sp. T6]|nr:hypothetical protein T06_16216 [Trichinella sp. T6]